MAGLVVLGPVAALKDQNGKVLYYYQGASLPDGVDPVDLARLQALGLVGEEKALVAPATDPTTGVAGPLDPVAVAAGVPERSAEAVTSNSVTVK